MFKRLFGLLVFLVGVLASYVFVLLPRHLRWGATEDEGTRELPGDDYISDPLVQGTRAVTIRAPREDVWPWLVQMGQGRGGFYSYDWLENLIGLNVHSAQRIVPELQHLRRGDSIRLAPGDGPSLTVHQMDAPHHMVLVHHLDAALGRNVDPDDPAARAGLAFSWAFVLEQLAGDRTRLLVRERYSHSAERAQEWIAHLIVPVDFVMTRGMMLGIKRRAERHAKMKG